MKNDLDKSLIEILAGISPAEWCVFGMIIFIGMLIWIPISNWLKEGQD